MKTVVVLLMMGLGLNSIGQDAPSVTIGNLEIMTQDSGKMNFSEAQKACEELGDDWRLPAKN